MADKQPIPQTLGDTVDFYLKKLSGGTAKGSSPAGLSKVEKALRDADGGSAPAAPPADPNASNYVDPKTGIRFADGGQVGMTNSFPKQPNPTVRPFGSKPGAKPC